MNRKYGCAILAGGAGSRMGNVNKANLEYMGRAFSETIMSQLEETEMPCYISVANYEQKVSSVWNVVRDIVTDSDGKYIGPVGGIYSCLKKAYEDGLDGLFFAPCDAPFYTREIIHKLSEYIEADTDIVLFRTPDGRLQTTSGWYSVRCIPAMEDDITAGKYKIRMTIDKLNCRIVNTDDAGIDSKAFSNINRPEDYRDILADYQKRHILICAKRQVGKTTLIEKVIQDIKIPIYGYCTKIFRDYPDGINRVYMFSACDKERHRGTENYIGSTRDGIIDVKQETFELLGTELVRSAKPDGIIVMDEIGFMESGSAEFCKAVTDAFDDQIHILASIKDTEKFNTHIDTIRNHPDAELIMLTEENRDQMTARVQSIVHGWEQDILGVKQ